MCPNKELTIVSGQYVILQRKDYKKIHLLSDKNKHVFLGKDRLDLDEIYGKKIGSTFKMLPKVGFNRQFSLQLCSANDISSAGQFLKDLRSGVDNRSIYDDGSSQLLTSNLIEELRDSGTTPKAIIEQLVENSKTFQIKTEFSQEKYIKKKEKKYFEYVTILRPTIRLIADIFYNRDIPKSIGIRIDTLSQITTAVNFQTDGNYLLVESGFNGIVAATLLSYMSDEGKLIHITPGNQNQKQAVLAMNFSSSRISQLMTVRLSTLNKLLEKNEPLVQNSESPSKTFIQNQSPTTSSPNDTNGLNVLYEKENSSEQESSLILDELRNELNCSDIRKRKHAHTGIELNNQEQEPKKPRWAIEAEFAVEVLLNKVDGLIMACKEYPLFIFNNLLEYLLPSRPFVIYSLYHEPLLTLYLQFKQRHDIVYLKISETWLRPYQILPERSHPAVTVSSSSGYLLSGIKVLSV